MGNSHILTSPEQAKAILNLIESKWDYLLSNMPMKICFLALEYEEWPIITVSDRKNMPWSYHNGGSWPTLLWQFTIACIRIGMPNPARRAEELSKLQRRGLQRTAGSQVPSS
eukprot:Gb_23042 [translate_table: standard]